MARKYVIGDSFFHGEYIPLQATTASGDDYLYHKSRPPENSDNVGESDVHPFHDFAEHAKQVSEDLRQKSIDARRLKDQLRETGSATQSVEQSLEDLKQKLQQHQQHSKVDHYGPSHEAESPKKPPPDPPDQRTHHHHHGKHKREKAAGRDHQLEWLNYLAADNAKRLQDSAKRLRNAQFQNPTKRYDRETPVIEPEPPLNSAPQYKPIALHGYQPPPILPHVREPVPDHVHEQIHEHVHEHINEHVREPSPAPTPTPQPEPIDSLAAQTFDNTPTVPAVDPKVLTTSEEFEQLPSNPVVVDTGDTSEVEANVVTASAYTQPQPDERPPTARHRQPARVSQRPPPDTNEQIFYNGQFYEMSSDQISKLLANMGYLPIKAAVTSSSRPSKEPTRKPHGMVMPLGERIRTSGVEGRFRNPSILRLYRQHRLHRPDELMAMAVDTGGPPAYSATQRPIEALAQSYDTRPPQPARDDQSYESSQDYDDGYAYAQDMSPRRRRPPPHQRHPHHHEPVPRSGPTHHYSGYSHSHTRHPHRHHRTDHAAHSHAHKSSAHGRHHHEYERRHDQRHSRPHAHHTPHNLHQHQVHRHQLREAEYAHRHVHHAPRSIQQASQQTIVELLQKLSQTQKQLELPPVAVSDDDRDDDKRSSLLEALEALDSPGDGEPPPRATKTGAIVLGVLGALWLSYIGYLNNVTEE